MQSELREKRETEILYKLQNEVINGLTHGAIEREKKTARINMILIICVPLSILLNIYALSLPKTITDIVEIAPWGETKYLKGATQVSLTEESVPEIAREWQVREFITNLRTLSIDQDVVYGNYKKCYAAATKFLGEKLTQQIQGTEWMKEIGEKKRSIIIESVIKVSEYSYQVDWREINMSSGGDISNEVRVRGVVTIKIAIKNKTIINPLGIYLTDYESTVLQQETKK